MPQKLLKLQSQVNAEREEAAAAQQEQQQMADRCNKLHKPEEI